MSDLLGWEAEGVDVEAFVADLVAEPDAAIRYARASAASVLHQAVVERLGAIRAGAIASMHDDGASYASIATNTGLTRARVQQLVERTRL
jgi:hypothetical protein